MPKASCVLDVCGSNVSIESRTQVTIVHNASTSFSLRLEVDQHLEGLMW